MDYYNSVVDIRNSYTIQPGSLFAVDTNVLYWYHYSRSVNPPSENRFYIDLMDYLIENNMPLFTTIYNMTELFNIIENNEYRIYKNIHNVRINKKEFRRDPIQRANVKRQLDATYASIKTLYKIDNFYMKIGSMDKYRENLSNHRCDIFDYYIFEHHREKGCLNLITHDADAITFEGLNIYTANNKAINEFIHN